MANEYEKEAAKELAQMAIAAGYDAYIAEKGNYGFYCDKEGNHLVSFQVDRMVFGLSGNYVTKSPRTTGTGWRITMDYPRNATDLHNAYHARAPRWATNGVEWRYKTVAEYLKDYQSSSKFSKVDEVARILNALPELED